MEEFVWFLCYFLFASEIIPRVFSLKGLQLWIQCIRLFTFLYFFFSALCIKFQIYWHSSPHPFYGCKICGDVPSSYLPSVTCEFSLLIFSFKSCQGFNLFMSLFKEPRFGFNLLFSNVYLLYVYFFFFPWLYWVIFYLVSWKKNSLL